MHDREQFYYNSASNPVQQKAPYYWEPNEVAEFTSSQRATVPQDYQVQHISHDPFELERALLMEANREAIRLIDEQEKCMPLLSDNVSPNERVENVGRMKQISEQIKGNN